MKITISRAAEAFALDTDEKITDSSRLRKLDGLNYSKDRCSRYLDPSLQALGITGGAIRLAFDGGKQRLRVVTEHQAPRRLKPAELKRLVAATVGQWSDGIGEGEFLHRKKLGMDVDLYPSRGARARAEQTDDGKSVKKPRTNALLEGLQGRKPRQALQFPAEGAEVGCKDRDGDTPLHLACLYGYFDLARRLLDCGADARATNRSGASPLACLAMAEAPRRRRQWPCPWPRHCCKKVRASMPRTNTASPP